MGTHPSRDQAAEVKVLGEDRADSSCRNKIVKLVMFHNDVEHPPRRKVRFAPETDIQIIADSSRRAEVREITRALAESRNDIAQMERDGFVLLHFHQQCDDLEARSAV